MENKEELKKKSENDCKKCKSKSSVLYIEREGYVCNNCGWTKIFNKKQ